MTAAPKLKTTVEAYLAAEEVAKERSEFIRGEVFAMAGGSAAHAILGGRSFAALDAGLRKQGCRVFNGDLAVQVAEGEAFLYPDVSVVCGPPEFGAGGRLSNPSLLVEVLSPSTERFDRGEKFALYRSLPSLTDYLLVSSGAPRVEHYRRGEGGLWLYRVVEGLAAELELPNQGMRLSLAGLYEGLDALPND